MPRIKSGSVGASVGGRDMMYGDRQSAISDWYETQLLVLKQENDVRGSAEEIVRKLITNQELLDNTAFFKPNIIEKLKKEGLKIKASKANGEKNFTKWRKESNSGIARGSKKTISKPKEEKMPRQKKGSVDINSPALPGGPELVTPGPSPVASTKAKRTKKVNTGTTLSATPSPTPETVLTTAPATARAKKTLSAEQKKKMADGRARAKAEREAMSKTRKFQQTEETVKVLKKEARAEKAERKATRPYAKEANEALKRTFNKLKELKKGDKDYEHSVKGYVTAMKKNFRAKAKEARAKAKDHSKLAKEERDKAKTASSNARNTRELEKEARKLVGIKIEEMD